MSDENLAQCRAMEQQCPGEVMQLESCPLQFACPNTAQPSASDCPAADAPCMNDENHQACLDTSAQCPGNVLQLESCPLQFECGE